MAKKGKKRLVSWLARKEGHLGFCFIARLEALEKKRRKGGKK